jgi:hypothetical protein
MQMKGQRADLTNMSNTSDLRKSSSRPRLPLLQLIAAVSHNELCCPPVIKDDDPRMPQATNVSEPIDRPIAFSTAMVRVVLVDRKTQTRRLIFPQPDIVGRCAEGRDIAFHAGRQLRCPFGLPGDRLWVRERWAYRNQFDNPASRDPGPIVYAADPASANLRGRAWRMSRSLPKIHSRIILQINDIRIERLNRISQADARAEGYVSSELFDDPVQWFRSIWDELFLERDMGWKKNPLVWVVAFKVQSVNAKWR